MCLPVVAGRAPRLHPGTRCGRQIPVVSKTPDGVPGRGSWFFCLTWKNVAKALAGGPGFEPGLTESESAVLPLNYPPRDPADPAGLFLKTAQVGREEVRSALRRGSDRMLLGPGQPPCGRLSGSPRANPARAGTGPRAVQQNFPHCDVAVSHSTDAAPAGRNGSRSVWVIGGPDHSRPMGNGTIPPTPSAAPAPEP